MNLEGRRALTRLPNLVLAAVAPCLTRTMRIELRDEAIGKAVAKFYANSSVSKATKQLAEELAGGGTPGTPKGDVVALILALNGGKRLGGRRLLDLVGGAPRSELPKTAQPIASARATAATMPT
jgi:hypothetical protein